MDRSYKYVRITSRWLTLLTLAALLLAGCSPSVPQPTSDSTPPTVRWHIINKADNSTQDIPGSGTIAAKSGDFYVVTFFAEDPQGIHKIDLTSNTSWQCISGTAAQSHGPSLGVNNANTLQPDGQGNVVTSTFLIENASVGPFDCQSGFAFSGGNLTFSGSGENYFNGTTQATLAFTVAP